MKVSVIITVYNLEKYILQTLESVFNQTYKDIEIIIVDDCSIDNSKKIIHKYIDKIIYLKLEKNSGVLLATCAGMKLATGDIISFLDGDDIWKPHKVEKIVEQYKNTDSVLVSHDYEYIDQYNNKLLIKDNSQEKIKKLVIENNYNKINYLMKKGIMVPNGTVWLGSAFSINPKKINLLEFYKLIDNLKEPHLIYQDWPLAFFILMTSKNNFSYINEKLFQYRLHTSNYSGGSEMTLDRAKKIALKGLYTSEFIFFMLKKYKSNLKIEDYLYTKKYRQLSILKYQFLLNLYNRNLIKAYPLFFHLSFHLWNKKEVLKNFLRLIAFTFIGSNIFKLKSIYYKLAKR